MASRLLRDSGKIKARPNCTIGRSALTELTAGISPVALDGEAESSPSSKSGAQQGHPRRDLKSFSHRSANTAVALDQLIDAACRSCRGSADCQKSTPAA